MYILAFLLAISLILNILYFGMYKIKLKAYDQLMADYEKYQNNHDKYVDEMQEILQKYMKNNDQQEKDFAEKIKTKNKKINALNQTIIRRNKRINNLLIKQKKK